MAIDDASDPRYQFLQHTFGHDLPTASAVYDLIKRHDLDPFHGYAVHAAIQTGLSEATALSQVCAPTASPLKRPLSSPSPPSPTRPTTSPPPRIGSRYGKAPEDWRSWIANRRRLRGGQGPLTKSTLIESDDVA